MRLLVRFGILLLAAASLAGCVESKTQLLPESDRVLLFLPDTRFEVHDLKKPNAQPEIVRFLVDPALVLRPLDEKGASSNDRYTVHPLSADRFLVEVWQNDSRAHLYVVLQIKDGALFASLVDCAKVDEAAFKAAGGTIAGGICSLETAPDPVALLRLVAEKTDDPSIKLIPIR